VPKHDADAEFERALDALKALSMDPSQPGESPEWRRSLAAAAARLSPAIEATSRVQATLLDEAEAESPALVSHIAQLRDEAAAIAERWRAFRDEVAQADVAAGEDPIASGEFEKVRTIREDLMAWIDRARVHDSDVRTAHVEAFYRDRGVVD